MLADGLTNRQIAGRLYLSYETIKWHNKQIYGKLGVRNRAQATSRARQLGLLDRDGVSSIKTSARARNKLPAPITSFVGREKEIHEISGLIRQKSIRLVTLTGPGGISKTRLALEAASRLSAEFPDGVYFVPLSHTRHANQLETAIATGLGLDLRAEREAAEALIEHLAQLRLLALIDNFEHLIEAGPFLLELLSGAAGLCLLVTSREALQVYGETEYPVPPMTYPEPNRPLVGRDLLAYESVALFGQRAEALDPRFRITDQNWSAIAEICARLEGLPLAIELVTSRLKQFNPTALRDQLRESFSLQKTGPRGVPDRQRTLQATISWSYGLLEVSEQSVLLSLSVFQGGFTLEAANHLLGGNGVAGVEDRIESLANKNLLVRASGSHFGRRFRMLNIIREFAQELVAHDPNEQIYRRRHAKFFAALAEGPMPGLYSPAPIHVLARLEEEDENLHLALDWALTEGDRTLGLRLVASLRDYWYFQGPREDSRRWAELALHNVDQARPALRAGAEHSAAHILIRHGDLDRAKPLLAESLGIYRKLGDQGNVAWSLVSLAFASIKAPGEFEQAIANCNEGLSLFSELHDEVGVAAALSMKGKISFAHGDLMAAEMAYLEGLNVSRRTGNQWREGTMYAYLGLLERFRERYGKAESYLRRCVRLSWDIEFNHLLAFALAALAGPLATRGDSSKAAILLGGSSTLRDLSHTMQEAMDQAEIDGISADVRDRLGPEAYEAAYSKGRLMPLRDVVALALEETTT